jgi:hypothetical protein
MANISLPSLVDRIFVLWAANIFVRSKKWLVEWNRLTSDRDRSSALKHDERNTLESPGNNESSSLPLVIRRTFDGREDSQPFFDLERLHGEAFFLKYQ